MEEKRQDKFRRARSPKRLQQMTKEQLAETLKKKKECNEKALKIVEELLERNIEHDIFLMKIRDINQSHYQDIIEERAIEKLCGYPLCNNTLPDDIPKKQYQISTRANKVYDITERKLYCSNNCYKSSIYIKEQMLTSPLWLRDQEIIPEFKLLNLNN